MPGGVYAVLLLSGLVGSLGHCLGMCGPLVLMVGLQLQTRGLAAVPYHLLYHLARVGVYALLGAIVGAVGSLLGLGSGLNRMAGAISLALGLVVVLLGLGYLGWLPVGRLDGASGWLSQAMGRVLLLGAINGLLPCGLVYSALLLAAATGGALPAALGMALFGLGTLPALVVVGVGAGSLSGRFRQVLTRVAGVVIVIAGLQLALRGLAALGVIPHLQAGGLVIW
jgi:sulfite exporter TauE/SafE